MGANAGKGRGVLATGPMQHGDIVMVSEPVGHVIRGPEGKRLTGMHLLPELSKPGVLSQEDRCVRQHHLCLS
jgi:hypothetical protein